MLLLAVGNGTLREFVFKKHMSDLAAHQLSTVTLILFFSAYIFILFQKFPPESARQAFFIGLLWLILTEVFEFGFGLYRGIDWLVMLADYNIVAGRLWILIPLWLLLAPVIFYYLKNAGN